MFLLLWIVLFMVRIVLDTQLLNNNQIYNQQAKFAQQQSHAQPSDQTRTYGGAKDVALANTNAGYVASKFDVMQHPLILVQNILFGLLAAIGITRLGEVLVNPNLEKLKKGVSHEEALTHAPMYRFGKALDKIIEKTPFLPKIIEKTGEYKKKFIGFLGKSDILSELGKKYKEGTQVLWSMGKVYQDGKGTEALDEFVDFLERDPEKKFLDVKTKVIVDNIMKQVKEEKLTKAQAAKQIIEKNLLEGVSAEKLKEALSKDNESKKSIGVLIDKIFGTTPNINSALAKAKFFNSNVKGLGPISRGLNNLSLMVMEGVGGGVLGGKMAMVMSIMGLVSAFNACSKAGIAKKEKEKMIREGNFNPEQIKEMKKGPWVGEQISAFMEDFSGFTLGAYIMTFPIGVALNKFLGFANLGRDNKLIKDAAEKLGVHGDDKLYQRSLIHYNDAVQNDKIMDDFIKILEGKKKHTLWSRFRKSLGIATDESIRAEMIAKLKLKIDSKSSKAQVLAAIRQEKSLKTEKWFTENRKMLQEAGKSQLTWGSIFKENAYNKGGGLKRLIRFAVQKPLEISTKILGLGKFKLYKKNAGFTNFFKRWGGRAGGIGRIALVGFVLTVPFRNAFMKISHKIFGKPSFSQYDEVKGVYDEEKIKKQKAELSSPPTLPSAPKAKIKIPQQETGPVFQPQPPAYQQQVTPSNPYENEIKPAEDIKPAEENNNVPNENPVRNLDNYTYVPKV